MKNNEEIGVHAFGVCVGDVAEQEQLETTVTLSRNYISQMHLPLNSLLRRDK